MFNYFKDGACWQAQAVMCYLQTRTIECSWSKEHKKYMAEPEIARWHNCREQGYVISMRSAKMDKQINIAFFEHRNSDSIHAVKREEVTINPPTIDSDTLNEVYKSKFDTSFHVEYGKITAMGAWIEKQLEYFWKENMIKEDNK